jgi:hypothetical protein
MGNFSPLHVLSPLHSNKVQWTILDKHKASRAGKQGSGDKELFYFTPKKLTAAALMTPYVAIYTGSWNMQACKKRTEH